VNVEATAGRCPNCSSPLALDAAGRCQYCSARYDVALAAREAHASLYSNDPVIVSSLVPNGLDHDGVPPFVSLIISSLGLLSSEARVRDYLAAQPEAHQAIRALVAAVAAAGVRVRDSGLTRDMFSEALRQFAAAEIWVFNLAIDVIAMLGQVGLTPGDHALVRGDLQTLDQEVREHYWQQQVHAAGAGPAQFRDLRAYVPHHGLSSQPSFRRGGY